ncbi:MAG: hypothetical protein JEZ12_28095 [Desulfobacterium sp.]|nr:hypothetical protein [Desulfobacterium sp.]
MIRKNRIINYLLLVFSTIAVLAVVELTIRYSGLWQKASYEQRTFFCSSSIPDVPYMLKPGIKTEWAGSDITINSIGLREFNDLSTVKTKTRILCLGDSITFGLGVNQSRTYPEQLQSMLNKSGTGQEYEVINAGISGFSAMDEAAYLKHLIKVCQPDLIIWLPVENDYDDSLGVNKAGQMIHGIPGYAATNSYLQSIWGVTGNCLCPDNILKSMGKRHRCWAEGTSYDEKLTFNASVDAFFSKHSYAYSFFKSRLKVVSFGKSSDGLRCGNDCIVRNKPILNHGFSDYLPEISSIFLSPYYKNRFYGAINAGIKEAAVNEIPMLILPLNMLLTGISTEQDGSFHLADITEYLGMPFQDFRIRFNLGWDGHLSPAGNQKLADAVLNCLIRSHLYPIPLDEQNERYLKNDYWKEYQLEEQLQIDSLKTMIDFKNFKNINQIIGGIYPPCTFPIKERATLSIILGNIQTNTIIISGHNSALPQKVLFYFGDAEKSIQKQLEIPSKDFTLKIGIPEAISRSRVTDLQLTPISKQIKSESIKLHYIGEEPEL